MTAALVLLAALAAGQPAMPGETPYPAYLDTVTIGAAAFRKANPGRDGRGVAIAVLDTGVDMGVPGLDRLPGGGPKVVDARDFTGESVVECQKPDVEKDERGEEVWRVKDGWVKGVAAIPDRPKDGPVWLGFLDESRFRNSAVPDLNGNGRTDDRFAAVLFRGADGEWRVVVDRGGDRDVAADPPVRSYAAGREYVTLAGHDPTRATPPLHIAVTIDAAGEGAKKVEFHVPSGSHGTHVAGIAAGWRLNGQDGYDGVAPGAVVLSLKIGDNTLAGGASVTDSMRKALEHAAKWGREHGMPVVANISYGVGSEVEGQADIDKWIDRFAEENPHVVVVTSAGNQGPGLSTVGSPAASLHVLAVAAAYGQAQARDLLGSGIEGERMFQYSSRGGEAAKPDVAAPGIAASTVPPWSRGDVMRGTSMAAPQGAGAAALVLSGAPARGKGIEWNSGMLRRALRDGARPVRGYGTLDAGAGMIDVTRAAAAFDAMTKDAGAAILMDVEVRTVAPTLPGGKARAAFWRAGGYAPDRERPAAVTLRPRFTADAAGPAKAAFWKSFSLSADASWVRLSRRNVYLKGEGEAAFDLWVERDAVKAPGVHVANVSGRAGTTVFSFPVAVVTPYPAAPLDGVPAIERKRTRLQPGDVVRVPISPPPGTHTMEVRATASQDAIANAFLYLYDSRGRKVPLDSSAIASDRGLVASGVIAQGDLLEPGTLELALHAFPGNRQPSEVDLEVRFHAFAAEPIRAIEMAPGALPKARVEVTNLLAVPFAGRAEGRVAGCERTLSKQIGQDRLREGFHLSREVESVEVDMRLSPEDWARFTDVSVNVTDGDGRTVARHAFDTRVLRFTVRNPDPARPENDLAMEVVGGRATSGGPSARLDIAMRFAWREPVSLAGTVAGARRIDLYPSVATTVDLKASATPRACPSGEAWFGSVDLTSERDGRVWLRVPVGAKP
ncbi:MAG: S8 family serine peptidase [Deltaproteobacteria bacterium]|nr:S8 family serine peptidase [Deltaproteobacteria bacterium]